MVSYEYRVFITPEPLTQVYMTNEYGIDGYKLVSVLPHDNMYYYTFQRCNKLM